MSEEEVTMSLIEYLKAEGWYIVSFDYPGSGTGKRLHKNGTRHKNKDTIVPDIIAVKENVAMLFENKNRFYKPDFEKQHSNIVDNLYSDDVENLLKPYSVDVCLWGIGIPNEKYRKSSIDNLWMVDFLWTVMEDKTIIRKK